MLGDFDAGLVSGGSVEAVGVESESLELGFGEPAAGGFHERAQYDLDVDYSSLSGATTKYVQVKVSGRNQDSTSDDVDYTVNYTAGQDSEPPAPTYYTVSCDARGGSPVPQPQRVESGKTASRPSAPSRDGYTFDGWYTAASGGSQYDFSTPVTGDTTLYAHWTKKETPKPSKLIRLYGDTRYDTMSEIVSEAFPSHVDTVVVTSGDNYPDALAASALAGGLNAALVTTQMGSLSSQAETRIRALSPRKIVVVGGPNMMPDSTLRALRSLLPSDGQLVSDVYGQTRYETAEAIYQQGKTELGVTWGKTAIVATGDGYADALSVASYAYAEKAPIFLVSVGQQLPDSVLRKLYEGGFNRILLVGGATVVSGDVAQQVWKLGMTATRLGGSTRYETSVDVADWVTSTGGFGTDTVTFATGSNYADALAAAPLAGALNAPIVLTGSSALSPEAAQQIKRIKASEAVIIGGINAVSKNTATSVQSLVGSVPVRIAGATRYETAWEIYLQGKSRLNVQWARDESIIATGENFADALSVSSYAYAK